MKKLVIGILAHVDAGKTTLSEAVLYQTKTIRALGRVDHRDAFLDTDGLERERGITIFSKQAVFQLGEREVTLLDTPGHVDFSAEMERVLQVLDCAVLVISGTDGVQAHTLTLWQLLEKRGVPVFLFVNKMDLAGTSRAALLENLRARLGEGCMDFSGDRAAFLEEAATAGEDALTEYLDTGTLSDGTLAGLIARRAVFPCWFGSALKLEGVEAFLKGLDRYAPKPEYPEAFGAKVYKIGRDAQGARLTYLKITGGSLRVKALLTGKDRRGDAWEEKAEQLRIYSGTKFRTLDEAESGTVCAVTGLSRTYAGQGLGREAAGPAPELEPVLNYQILLPEGADPHAALDKLRTLEEEDPQLHIFWNERLQELNVRLMGQVQLEVLRRVIAQRFGLEVDFGPGSIVYKETIAAPAEGVGHYEPLRHYAEVRLLLEPGEPGSGLRFATACSEDRLGRNWQRLILTHLEEKVHLGVLTGSPITDMKITLTAGRAHLKHTEGGDFRQATYRAVRQGLMCARSVLLEPWYDFRLELPGESLGRAMTDVQQMGGRFDPPEALGGTALLTGSAPASELGSYWQALSSYTRGRGRLNCTLRGYEPCHNAEEVIAALDYDPEADLDNSPDSIFCAHGAGFPVRWDEVPNYAHLEGGYLEEDGEEMPEEPAVSRSAPRAVPPPRSREEEKELQAIFERAYGQVRRRGPDPGEAFRPRPKPPPSTEKRTVPALNGGPEYLLVDGYNIIFAWEPLKAAARENLERARYLLMDLLCNFQGYQKCVVILVFAAYKVKGNPGSVEKYRNINVVYTKEAETADAYIERTTYQIAREGAARRVRVATSDNLEQLIILGHGAVRVSAREFQAEVEAAEGAIADIIQRHKLGGRALRPLRPHLQDG
ncbi:MAG: TetM/TetW/TetO/TetS family tetracycline resistance ribosomal protection protein [Oscillospiraceae bacterium]|nr:TetM/TetW/TetO/TetS family tetracycline resistance ribosomal protection protein [Oscillospiraceae bacterium]